MAPPRELEGPHLEVRKLPLPGFNLAPQCTPGCTPTCQLVEQTLQAGGRRPRAEERILPDAPGLGCARGRARTIKLLCGVVPEPGADRRQAGAYVRLQIGCLAVLPTGSMSSGEAFHTRSRERSQRHKTQSLPMICPFTPGARAETRERLWRRSGKETESVWPESEGGESLHEGAPTRAPEGFPSGALQLATEMTAFRLSPGRRHASPYHPQARHTNSCQPSRRIRQSRGNFG